MNRLFAHRSGRILRKKTRERCVGNERVSLGTLHVPWDRRTRHVIQINATAGPVGQKLFPRHVAVTPATNQDIFLFPTDERKSVVLQLLRVSLVKVRFGDALAALLCANAESVVGFSVNCRAKRLGTEEPSHENQFAPAAKRWPRSARISRGHERYHQFELPLVSCKKM